MDAATLHICHVPIKSSLCAFVDHLSAFDSVSRTLLIHKLKQLVIADFFSEAV